MINKEDYLDYGGTYTTVEALKKAEQREKGKINWELWDKLVQKLREEFKNYKTVEHTIYKTKQPLYVYSYNYNLIKYFPSITSATKELGIRYNTIYRYANEGMLYKKKGLRFSTYDIHSKEYKDEATYKIKDPGEKPKEKQNKTYTHYKPKQEVFVYNSDNELIGHFPSIAKTAINLGVTERTVTKYLLNDTLYKRKNLRFSKKPII